MTKQAPLIILTAQRPWVYRKHPPFGILYLARSLMDAGFRVRIVHPLSERKAALLRAVAEERPLFAGLSVIATPLLAEDIEISKALHEAGVPVVWGGIYASMMPGTALGAEYVDYILAGEAELTVVELARALSEGRLPDRVPGAGFKQDSELVLNPEGRFHDQLDQFRPAWELINLKEYLEFFHRSGDLMMAAPLARGCPYLCAFCYNQSNPERRRFRIHGEDWVKEQLDFLKRKLKINMVRWICDNPFGKVEEGKRVIMAADMPWVSTARIDLMSRGFCDWLVESKCRFLSFGFEAGTDKALKILKKGFTVDQMAEGVKNLDRAGIWSSANWMHLIPGETDDDRRETRMVMDRLFQMSKRIWHEIQGLRPYPDTPIWNQCLKMGLTPPRTNQDWTRVHSLIAPLFGWSEKKLRRLVLLTRILYGQAGAAPRVVSDRQYAALCERFLIGEFAGPVEEQMEKWPSLKKLLYDE